MKKILITVFSCVVAVMLCFNSFAVSPTLLGEKKIVENNGYVFPITEYKDSDLKIIRQYENNMVSNYENNMVSNHDGFDIEQVRALLISLGIDESNVNKYSLDTLAQIAECERIVSTTSYSKYDKSGKHIYVDEKNALSVTREIELKEQANFIKGVLDDGEPAVGEYEDSYMRVVHTAFDMGGGMYLFTTDSVWLTMPLFRGYDSIGSCAMNATVTPDSGSGSYSYDALIVTSMSPVVTETYLVPITVIQEKETGSWYGAAGIFNLPDNVISDTHSIRYSNVAAHFQYNGHVNHPGLESYFNSNGSYSHSTLALILSPSISINSKGEFSAEIGLNTIWDTDVRTASVEVHYVPGFLLE
ncbi:MAG: hypothetical protein IJX53_06535 [Clostridia bacterium]|nr:hypothetical protein [Clostridia bacterium]